MPLSEDKRSRDDRLTIQRFEKMLMELLQRHARHQKKIAQLTEENEALKGLLQASKTSASTAVKNKSFPSTLVDQINAYIKEIDLCLAYFEQT